MALRHQKQRMREEDWLVVRATEPFSVFPESIVRSLIAGQTPRVFEKGSTVFKQGEAATSIFIVLKGLIKITRVTAKGTEVVVGIVHSCEIIGESAIFLDRQYPVGAEVIRTSRLLPIEGAAVVAQLKKKPILALQMLALASSRFGALVEQIERIKGLDGQQRVADFFLQLCPCRTGSCSVELPFEKCLIAYFLGITPQTFSRILTHLRAVGVKVEREKVTIEDVQRLSDFVRV